MQAPDGFVVALVLLAALLHAVWNTVAKTGSDRLLTLWLVIAVGSALGAVGICFLPPLDPRAWPFLAGSFVTHAVYHLFLVRMYRLGDLSQVYPIARGIAPVLVGLGAAVFVGESLGAIQLAGLALSSGAICTLALASPGHAVDARSAVVAALLAGVLNASNMVVDGQGVRHAGSELTYISWSFLVDFFPVTVAVVWLRRGRIAAFVREEGVRSCAGGLIATLSYSIVLWAVARGAMAHVSALRETSVLLAAWIGTRLLGEPFGGTRVVAAAGVVAGVLLLRC